MCKTIISLLICAVLQVLSLSAGNVSFGKLTVEGRDNPIGIDDLSPRFGWQLRSTANGTMQQSYRLLVASSMKSCEIGKADIWDSKEIKSDESQWIEYEGPALSPTTQYYWRVIVETSNGNAVSDIHYWTTGLINSKNWAGHWIGCDSITPDVVMDRHSRISARYLHKDFHVKKGIRRATAHICGLGYYLLDINGQRIGSSILAPAPTQYDKAVIYNTFDVTEFINREESSIDITLGPGFFFAMTQNFQTNVRTSYGMPKAIMNLIIEYDDNTQEVIATDKTWMISTDGPIRYANLYDGTLVDFNKTDMNWRSADIVGAPCQELRGNTLGGVTVHSINQAFSVNKTGEKRYIIDFGTNDSGRIFIDNVRIAKGDSVFIRYSETLKNGNNELYTDNLRGAQNTDIFIGNGEVVDVTSDFIWHGFRYAEITGLDIESVKKSIRQNMSDELLTNTRINIDEGDGIINKIVENARRGILSNYKGMPIDCPQRDERMPWLGDRTMGCFGESYLTYNHTLYAKWLTDICDAQRNDGCISDVSPAYWRLYNGNITWPATLPFGMEMMLLQYGDDRPIRLHYDNVKQFLEFARLRHMNDGLIAYDRYGDWCVPPARLDEVETKDESRITKGPLVSSSYYVKICRMMERFASLLNLKDDSVYFANEATAMTSAINSQFLNKGNYANGTVTANLLPLAFDIAPDSLRNTIERNMLARQGENIDCGVIGISWLMRYLSRNGNGNLAYRIASTTEYPGWGYMIANGATTIWELWNGNTANPSMNSGNHVMMLGDFIPWTFECLGGIAPDYEKPGFRHIIMKPDFSIYDINGVNAAYPSIYGEIISEWHRINDCIEWHVEIPCNTTATLYFHDGSSREINAGKYTFKNL